MEFGEALHVGRGEEAELKVGYLFGGGVFGEECLVAGVGEGEGRGVGGVVGRHGGWCCCWLLSWKVNCLVFISDFRSVARWVVP